MRPPLFVRPLSADEQAQLTAALRSSDAFTLRRAQSILASARGERAPRIARALGCEHQTVRAGIAAFHATGLAALRRGSSVPHTLPHKVMLPARCQGGDHPRRAGPGPASAGCGPSAGSAVPTRSTPEKKPSATG